MRTVHVRHPLHEFGISCCPAGCSGVASLRSFRLCFFWHCLASYLDHVLLHALVTAPAWGSCVLFCAVLSVWGSALLGFAFAGLLCAVAFCVAIRFYPFIGALFSLPSTYRTPLSATPPCQPPVC